MEYKTFASKMGSTTLEVSTSHCSRCGETTFIGSGRPVFTCDCYQSAQAWQRAVALQLVLDRIAGLS